MVGNAGGSGSGSSMFEKIGKSQQSLKDFINYNLKLRLFCDFLKPIGEFTTSMKLNEKQPTNEPLETLAMT